MGEFIFRKIIKWKIKSVGGCGAIEPSYIADGDVNVATVMEPNSFGSSES